jgi:hypothetical protein
MKLKEAVSKIDAYKKSKLAPGGFLTAILQNDLMNAILRADNDSRKIIVEITEYCWETLPHNSWGSPEKVEEYLYKRDSPEKFQNYNNVPLDIQ